MYPDKLDWLVVVCIVTCFSLMFLIECWMAYRLRITTKKTEKVLHQYERVILNNEKYIQLLIDSGEYDEDDTS